MTFGVDKAEAPPKAVCAFCPHEIKRGEAYGVTTDQRLACYVCKQEPEIKKELRPELDRSGD